MKKFLAIVVLGLFLSGSTYGSEVPQIKEKSLKCLYKDYKNKYKVNKENYLYLGFFISNNILECYQQKR